ncbi:MAG: response regulator transcription factor [Chloroflexota bacterium]|nr:response regulator transcription factor [Chloroflexota bacterium]
MTLKLLIAEDAPEIARAVAYGARLTWPGCRVVIARDGTEALQRFEEDPPDLVVLDVQMPPPNGFDVCQRIRKRSPVPILMLTVRDATLDKVHAFDLGADDYLTKPFDPLELLARLRALMRRAVDVPRSPLPNFVVGDLSIDFAARQVRVRSEEILLTPTEYRLLEELVRRAGEVVPHAVLLEQVWGPAYASAPHHLKVFVRRLRTKLGDDPEDPRYIYTIRGIGYRFITRP